MARRIVLADASPLVALVRVDGPDWLRKLFRTVSITKAVRDEVTGAHELPGATAISAALTRLDPGEASTAGIVVEARRAGWIPAARPVFSRIADEGFHLGDELVRAVLIELGE